MADKTEQRYYTDAQVESFKRALELSEEKLEMPAMATEDYRGPSEAMTAMIRGLALGIIGFYAGRSFGRMTLDLKQGAETGANASLRLFKWGGATLGTILGLYNGSNQVRSSRGQVRGLQRAIQNMHTQNVALKEELKDQLKGQGVLQGWTPEMAATAREDALASGQSEPETADAKIPQKVKVEELDETEPRFKPASKDAASKEPKDENETSMTTASHVVFPIGDPMYRDQPENGQGNVDFTSEEVKMSERKERPVDMIDAIVSGDLPSNSIESEDLQHDVVAQKEMQRSNV